MFSFAKEQKVAQIGGIKVGGQPGENPPLLIGSIFHKGDPLIEERGGLRFDRRKAKERIQTQEELSRETGLPCMLDIVANSGEEFRAYIDFIVGITDQPFAIDAWRMTPKLEAARYARELGLLDRMLYNSLTVWSEDMEREVNEIREIGVRHLVIVPFDDRDLMPSGRINSLHQLLNALGQPPFESVLVDTSVMNLPALGFCALANYRIKEVFGLPVGSAPSNGSHMWKEARVKWGKEGFDNIDSAIHSVAGVLWHDFLFYGPLSGATRVFPAGAAASAILATMCYGESGFLPPGENHPLRKLFAGFIRQLEEKK